MTNDYLAIRQQRGGDISDSNFEKEQNSMLLKIDQGENEFQRIKGLIQTNDKVSQQIRTSHLFQRDVVDTPTT